ncbi:xylose isomerase [Phycisphaera mikurensis]|uniref:Xylose isomerase n=1 Tax=Phycisphaera mikurensis (strain NBRC 102666 / KCTC 22515 / FYK2301M01) TaxID=1142394 RepID=I0IDJ0_PHYMF|nr:xylose isomerase [Phycisphaera mikurensis]MBB6441148.1 xylose isomerase [Phycisphaera mikurensis]BAM03328.1 xylose isomerase [Phycisphaera mikurensis NBRC 102666]
MPKIYFPDVQKIVYAGPDSTDPLTFKHYDPEALVEGKSMRDHLRFSASYWHAMVQGAADPFGGPTRPLPWTEASDPVQAARDTLDAMFEFLQKMDLGFWCFHDRDIAPELETLEATNAAFDEIVGLAEEKQRETGIKLLWGTANLFSHKRYMAGAGTSPCPEVFAHGAAQIKKALEATHRLGGAGYTFWGGREGYDTLLNTRLSAELGRFAKLLRLAVDHKRKIGFTGAFYIEPKPCEPTTFQYDNDAAACYAFLQHHGLEKEFSMNIEANHATLAGRAFEHELAYSAEHGILGSVDANRGDPMLGWDTDQFPTNLYDTTAAMGVILGMGGFTTGGLNFDARLRRQSVEPYDLFHAHIGGMDAFARGLKAAAKIRAEGRIEALVAERYRGWESELGRKIDAGEASLDSLFEHAVKADVGSAPAGRQERLENLLNEAI